MYQFPHCYNISEVQVKTQASLPLPPQPLEIVSVECEGVVKLDQA